MHVRVSYVFRCHILAAAWHWLTLQASLVVLEEVSSLLFEPSHRWLLPPWCSQVVWADLNNYARVTQMMLPATPLKGWFCCASCCREMDRPSSLHWARRDTGARLHGSTWLQTHGQSESVLPHLVLPGPVCPARAFQWNRLHCHGAQQLSPGGCGLFPTPQVSVHHWQRLGCLVGLEICFEIGVRKHFPSSWVFRVVMPLNLLWSVLVWLRAFGIIFVILRIKVAKEPRRRKTETHPSADQVWFAKLPASFWFLWLQLARAEWIALLSGCCL